MESVIYNLSNDDYHRGEGYRDYLSSSQLKAYAKSPKFAKFMLDNPQPETDAMRFGSLFHDLIASFSRIKGEIPKDLVTQQIDYQTVVFEPPINEKTSKPYGAGTKAYNNALNETKDAYPFTAVISQQEQDTLKGMLESVLFNCGATSEQIRKLLRWGKSEVSHFIEYEGCKFKWRPDLETGKKIVDWKTVATNDLSERSINAIISKYGYDISAAFYLFFEHERTGKWKTFYWVFVSKEPPYDAVLVDASEWVYRYDSEYAIITPEVGAIKMKHLLNLHIKCSRENAWPGAEISIPEDDFGRRIMRPTPPSWEINIASNILEQSI